MKGYRFHLEYETNALKRKGTRKELGPHRGNVIALSTESKPYANGLVQGRVRDYVQEGYSGVYSWPNSGVNWGATSLDFLRTNTRRISEAQARQIHPALFARLAEDAEREAATV